MKFDIDISKYLLRESQTFIDNTLGKVDVDGLDTNADFLANESGLIPAELRDDFLEYAELGRNDGGYLNGDLSKPDYRPEADIFVKGDMENFSAYVNVVAYATCGTVSRDAVLQMQNGSRFDMVRADGYGDWVRAVFRPSDLSDKSVFYVFRRKGDDTFSMVVISEYRNIELSFR